MKFSGNVYNYIKLKVATTRPDQFVKKISTQKFTGVKVGGGILHIILIGLITVAFLIAFTSSCYLIKYKSK